jgi:hypothetical protein
MNVKYRFLLAVIALLLAAADKCAAQTATMNVYNTSSRAVVLTYSSDITILKCTRLIGPGGDFESVTVNVNATGYTNFIALADVQWPIEQLPGVKFRLERGEVIHLVISERYPSGFRLEIVRQSYIDNLLKAASRAKASRADSASRENQNSQSDSDQ